MLSLTNTVFWYSCYMFRPLHGHPQVAKTVYSSVCSVSRRSVPVSGQILVQTAFWAVRISRTFSTGFVRVRMYEHVFIAAYFVVFHCTYILYTMSLAFSFRGICAGNMAICFSPGNAHSKNTSLSIMPAAILWGETRKL